MRAMNLANALMQAGHDVLLWSSAFYHQEKRHRTRVVESICVSDRLTVRLIPSRGYTRNIGPGRLVDHAQLGLNLGRELRGWRGALPDVAFVGFPPIETAAVMSRWLKRQGIPVMIDAKDQWPTIFVEPLPAVLRPVARLLLIPYFHFARRAMRDSDAFCAMSSEFVDWMCEISGRLRRSDDHVAPLSAPRPHVDEPVRSAAMQWWRSQGVEPATRRRVAFVGSLSSAFDFTAVRDLASACQSRGVDCQFVVCGDGDEAAAVRTMCGPLSNVVLPGWIDYPKIAALMEISSATVAPYINNDAFMRSIPNKIIDSMAAGLPVITTLAGTTGRLLRENSAGCSSLDIAALAGYLERLLDDPAYWSEAAANSRTIHEQRFSSAKVYGELAAALEKLSIR